MELKYILIILLFPSLCGASITMNPAKVTFDSSYPFKSGETYTLQPDFQVGNTFEESKSFVVSIECFTEEEGNCPDKSWFSFNPTEFTLEPHQTQMIHVEMTIPRSVSEKLYGDYRFLVSATMSFNNTEGESGTGQQAFGLGVGSIVSFKLAGKIPFWKSVLYFLQDKVGNPLSASLASLGIDPRTTLIIVSIFFSTSLLIFGIKKIIQKIRKEKVKEEIEN